MKARPYHDRILVRPHDNAKTPGGIIVPDTTKPDLVIGTVIGVSDGYTEHGATGELNIYDKDTVMFQRIAAIPVDLEGVRHYILSHKDVLLVLSPD